LHRYTAKTILASHNDDDDDDGFHTDFFIVTHTDITSEEGWWMG